MAKAHSLYRTESTLLILILGLGTALSLMTDSFLTPTNCLAILDASAINIIFAVGLLVVLLAGGIDISFSVMASVTQYLVVLALPGPDSGNWGVGFLIAAAIGFGLGAFNAFLIYRFRIVSIIASIATFNIYFGLLMFFTKGVSVYDLPSWLGTRVIFYGYETRTGEWLDITLPVIVMGLCVLFAWVFVAKSTTGRQIRAFGDSPESARRFGVSIPSMHIIAFGWMGVMAGIAGLMQAHYAQEIVPNALYGRELDVLAAVVLGGARLGGGRGTVAGCVLGVLLVSMVQNGLNLLGVSPFAFRMIVGAVILGAIVASDISILKRPSLAFSAMRLGRKGRAP